MLLREDKYLSALRGTYIRAGGILKPLKNDLRKLGTSI